MMFGINLVVTFGKGRGSDWEGVGRDSWGAGTVLFFALNSSFHQLLLCEMHYTLNISEHFFLYKCYISLK